ncbi:gamma-aminobutyrate transaminase POP2 [Cucumis melo var. makuwa]|uniref:Gamma-aminobutyrate transaminase POP2 n=1 Tax=Cucumis melo var. makuwa TaxID=1194695 RepID=A0A5A7SNY7_CUCMM|nr:gamma-aminobutyrate transaminase POP2 [Cucumis melo var. makuwa]
MTDIDPAIVERPIVRHVTDNFFVDLDEHLSNASEASDDDELYTMSSFPRTNFFEMDAIFLEFADDLDNLARGSSSVDDNSDESNNGSSSQPSATSTTRRRVQSRLLELEFVEHQMLNTFKEFRGDCHRHFKKYSDPEETFANPLYLLAGHDED